jgi:hypothetical protein
MSADDAVTHWQCAGAELTRVLFDVHGPKTATIQVRELRLSCSNDKLQSLKQAGVHEPAIRHIRIMVYCRPYQPWDELQHVSYDGFGWQ